MGSGWETTILNNVTEALNVFTELHKNKWLCRGQSRRFDCLVPSLDRFPRQDLNRIEELTLEKKSIACFRSTVRNFADPGEVRSKDDDIIALMVLQHYGVPTRLLDWSLSPWIAAFFACYGNDREDGEIWTFNEPLYEIEGAKQWRKWPKTTYDESGDPDKFRSYLTAFSSKDPPDWFICHFYIQGFPRQLAQKAAYSMTARFGRDHAASIQELLKSSKDFHLYILPHQLKHELQNILKEDFNIWRGSLFPDSAGAAETTKKEIFSL